MSSSDAVCNVCIVLSRRRHLMYVLLVCFRFAAAVLGSAAYMACRTMHCMPAWPMPLRPAIRTPWHRL